MELDETKLKAATSFITLFFPPCGMEFGWIWLDCCLYFDLIWFKTLNQFIKIKNKAANPSNQIYKVPFRYVFNIWSYRLMIGWSWFLVWLFAVLARANNKNKPKWNFISQSISRFNSMAAQFRLFACLCWFGLIHCIQTHPQAKTNQANNWMAAMN